MRTLLLLLLAIATPAVADLAEYTGRYEQHDGNVVYVELHDGALTLRPAFWRSVQYLVPAGEDRFDSRERPERHAVFTRERGKIVALTMNGIGHDDPMPRVVHQRRVPAELLMAGSPRAAARALLKRKDAAEIATAWGSFISRALPTKAKNAAAFVSIVAAAHPNVASLREVEGTLAVAAGDRVRAKRAFAAAVLLDPSLKNAAEGLRMLAPSPSLDALFATPTRSEIEAVHERWKARDLAARDVSIVHRGMLGDAEVRIVAHRVHGSLHYGVVIVPRGAKNAPVIVEAKGVSPSYFPLDLSRPLYARSMFGDNAIVFAPSYRGEVLLFDGKTFTSEGDRTDVWDGATDDFIAFTTAALSVTPEADASRLCAFGKSRGGAVAMLAGERDARYRCVVSWSGPADHFFAMVQSGWTPRERVAEGLRAKADVFGMAGQFIETFLAKPRDVAETRLHLIASSPLWSADRLPRTLAIYGLDDNMVSARNGRELAARGNRNVQVVLHEKAGHDLDEPRAMRETKEFVLRYFGDESR
ncbi:MAG TPA: prolyl oligopeptidase family serine peptidase [Thermoanaerobaculia bacterium]|nr:prolyl oligopeptidase family serine peptidase [Thermoanaerobaculia bacterium]